MKKKPRRTNIPLPPSLDLGMNWPPFMAKELVRWTQAPYFMMALAQWRKLHLAVLDHVLRTCQSDLYQIKSVFFQLDPLGYDKAAQKSVVKEGLGIMPSSPDSVMIRSDEAEDFNVILACKTQRLRGATLEIWATPKVWVHEGQLHVMRRGDYRVQFHSVPNIQNPWDDEEELPVVELSMKELYRALVRKWHPDLGKSPEDVSRRNEIMKEINIAYSQDNRWKLYRIDPSFEPQAGKKGNRGPHYLDTTTYERRDFGTSNYLMSFQNLEPLGGFKTLSQTLENLVRQGQGQRKV